MRYLTVVRHAKAAPASAGESDFDRPLSGRGRHQCHQLRAWASDGESLGRFGPTTAIVSSAQRTRETFERAFDQTPFVVGREFSELIYNGRREVHAEDLLSELAAIDPVTTSLLVVAHNPTVHEVVTSLARRMPHSLLAHGYPLGGAYVFELSDDQPVGRGPYELVANFIPD